MRCGKPLLASSNGRVSRGIRHLRQIIAVPACERPYKSRACTAGSLWINGVRLNLPVNRPHFPLSSHREKGRGEEVL